MLLNNLFNGLVETVGDLTYGVGTIVNHVACNTVETISDLKYGVEAVVSNTHYAATSTVDNIKDIIKTKPNNNNTNDYTLPVNYNVHLSEFMLNTMMKAETKIEEMKVREDAGRELINKIMINLGWECTENEMNKLMNNGYGKLLLINKDNLTEDVVEYELEKQWLAINK